MSQHRLNKVGVQGFSKANAFFYPLRLSSSSEFGIDAVTALCQTIDISLAHYLPRVIKTRAHAGVINARVYSVKDV